MALEVCFTPNNDITDIRILGSSSPVLSRRTERCTCDINNTRGSANARRCTSVAVRCGLWMW